MLRQVREGTHLADGLTFANFYKQHLQGKPQHTGGMGPMCYNVLFLMILTKALSHSLRATMCNWALGTMACIAHPHGPRYVACDCFLYLFRACMRQAPIVEKTPATCGSLRAHYNYERMPGCRSAQCSWRISLRERTPISPRKAEP